MASFFRKLTNNATVMVWANQVISVGGSLVILPILLKRFDEVEISFWFLVNVFLQLTMLADSGFGPTLVRAVSYFKAGATQLPKNKREYDQNDNADKAPNFRKLTDLLFTTRKIYNTINLVAAILLSTVGTLISWNIFKLSGYRIDFAVAYFLIIVNSFFILQIVRWHSFMVGLNYVAKVNRFNTLIGTSRLIAFISILLIVPNVLYLIVFNLLASVATLVYVRNFVRGWFTGNQCEMKSRKYFDKELFRIIWSATWKMGGIQWGNYLVNYGTSIIISQINNTTLMANFLFTQRIIFIFRRISEAPFYANIPKVYGLMAKRKFPEFRSMASKYIFLTLFILFTALGLVAIFGNWALQILDIQTRVVSFWIFIVLAITIIFEIHAEIHRNIYISTNQIPFLLPILISGALILILGFILLPVYGLLSVVLVQFVIQIGFNYWYPMMLSFRLVNWDTKSYIKDLYHHGFVKVANQVFGVIGNKLHFYRASG